MRKNTWTYGELTQIVEKEIDGLMEEARATAKSEDRRRKQCYAAGVLMGWMAIAAGDAAAIDKKRMRDKLRLTA
ncbi:hypothetical protein ACFQ3P_40090 [Paraburkholderia sabiae]|uniref:Uncharacterized protein n=1 Tax=Paraburkholderia sabiae TaxID=273251 RepID=A0ABU9QN55_9BURK|nr:hypothetical protein [Paraburkholderia sabiae]WJZ79982.1 hypothetical protein QEN71_43325 [Paraburkholderia sabiae]CAD6561198.1 hypothetical protein LMG24235_07217 [Paraburkholderia sabiae]